MIKLMKGDCLERMKEIESGSIDMILTDPPYILYKCRNYAGMTRDKGRTYLDEITKANMVEGYNIEKFLSKGLSLFDHKQKFCCVVTCSVRQLHEYLNWAILHKLQYSVGVWHKTNPAPLCNYKYLNDVEYWVYIKGNKSKIIGSYESKSMVYTSPINKKDKEIYKHPTIKPLKLMEKFIINHTVEGMTILDPFMGSGTTICAGIELNRNAIGIELDGGTFNTAEKRVNEYLNDKVEK